MHIATRRKAPHSTRLNLEALERRDTPAVSVSAVGNELQLNFSGNDQLSVHSSSGSNTYVFDLASSTFNAPGGTPGGVTIAGSTLTLSSGAYGDVKIAGGSSSSNVTFKGDTGGGNGTYDIGFKIGFNGGVTFAENADFTSNFLADIAGSVTVQASAAGIGTANVSLRSAGALTFVGLGALATDTGTLTIEGTTTLGFGSVVGAGLSVPNKNLAAISVGSGGILQLVAPSVSASNVDASAWASILGTVNIKSTAPSGTVTFFGNPSTLGPDTVIESLGSISLSGKVNALSRLELLADTDSNNSGSVTVSNNLAVGGPGLDSLVFQGASIVISSPVTLSGLASEVVFQPSNPAINIFLAQSSGTGLNVSSSTLDMVSGADRLVLGRADGTGNIRIAGLSRSGTDIEIRQSPIGAGSIILDDAPGFALNNGANPVFLTAGTGGIIAVRSNGIPEIVTTGATITLETTGGIGSATLPLELTGAVAGNPTVIIGATHLPSRAVVLSGIGDLVVGAVTTNNAPLTLTGVNVDITDDIGTGTGAISITATNNLSLGGTSAIQGGKTLLSAGGILSQAAGVTVGAGASPLELIAGTFTLSGAPQSLASAGSVIVRPASAGSSLGIGIVRQVNLSQADINRFDPTTTLILGSITQTGEIAMAGGVNFPNDTIVQVDTTSLATIRVDQGGVTGSGSLTLNAGLAPVIISGIGADVTVAGDLTINGSVLIGTENRTLKSSSGNIVINGAGGVASQLPAVALTLDAAGLINLSTTSFGKGGTNQFLAGLKITAGSSIVMPNAASTVNGSVTIEAGTGINFSKPLTALGDVSIDGGTGTVVLPAGADINVTGSGKTILLPNALNILLGADLTTNSGDINLAVPLELTDSSVSISSGGGKISFDTVTASLASARSLVLTAGTGAITFGDDVGTASSPLNTLTVVSAGSLNIVGALVAQTLDHRSATANLSFGGQVDILGANPLTLPGNTISFAAAFNLAAPGASLTLQNTGTASFNGPVLVNKGITQTTSGDIDLSDDVTANDGGISLNGNVTLLASLALKATSSISLGGALDGKFNLDVDAVGGAFNINGPIGAAVPLGSGMLGTGTGAALSVTTATSVGLAQGGFLNSGIVLAAGIPSTLAGAFIINGGDTDSVLPGAVTLNSASITSAVATTLGTDNTTLISMSGSILLDQSKGDLTVSGPISGIADLKVTGNGSVDFSAASFVGGKLNQFLTSVDIFAGNTVTLLNAPSTVLGDVRVEAGNGIDFGASLTASGTVTIDGGTGDVTIPTGANITLTGAGKALSLPNASKLLLGADLTTTGGSITINVPVELTDPSVSITSSDGTIFVGPVAASVPSKQSLVVTAGKGSITFNGDVGSLTSALDTLSIVSASSLDIVGDLAAVTLNQQSTTANLNFGGQVDILGGSPLVLPGNNISFKGAFNLATTGASLTLQNTGTASFDGSVLVDNGIKQTTSGPIELADDVTTTNGPIDLNGNLTLLASLTLQATTDITLDGLLDGPFNLTANTAGGAFTVNGPIGGNSALGTGVGAALNVTAAKSIYIAQGGAFNSGIVAAPGVDGTLIGVFSITGGDTGTLIPGAVTLNAFRIVSAVDTVFGSGALTPITFMGANTSFVQTAGDLTIDGPVDGNVNLAITGSSTGNVIFTGVLGATKPLGNGTGAAINIGAGSGPVEFQSDITSRSGLFQSASAGKVTFGGSILSGETKTPAVATELLGDLVFMDDSYQFGLGAVLGSGGANPTSVEFNGGNVVLQSALGSIQINGELSGVANLTVTSPTRVAVATAIGTATPLGGLAITSPTIVLAGIGQTGQAGITGNASLTATNLALGGSYYQVDGLFAISTKGTTSYSGDIGGPGTVRFNGPGTLALDGNLSLSGALLVPAGHLVFNGSVGAPTTISGGTLSGNGTFGNLTLATGQARPGNSPGRITTTNYVQGAGTLTVEVSGRTAGITYDQLVASTVTLGGKLSVVMGAGFKPAIGEVFTIIDNTGTNPVLGRFQGLPDRARFTIGTTTFTIRYNKGDGNDVTLESVFTPPPATGPKVANPFSLTGPGALALAVGNTGTIQINSGRNISQVFRPFVGYVGPLSVACMDRNADGRADALVIGAGVGQSHVLVVDAATGRVAASFLAYAPGFMGGVNVAAGVMRIDGTGVARAVGGLLPVIITGAGSGAQPNLAVFNFNGTVRVRSYLTFLEGFRGGISVASGDVNNDGSTEIIVGSGKGPAPHVVVFDAVTSTTKASFFAFPRSYRGGVYVASGELDPTSPGCEVIVGTNASPIPKVSIFSSTGQLLKTFSGFSGPFAGGVRPAVSDFVPGGNVEVVVVNGPQARVHLRVFRFDNFALLDSFFSGSTDNTLGAIVANNPFRLPD